MSQSDSMVPAIVRVCTRCTASFIVRRASQGETCRPCARTVYSRAASKLRRMTQQGLSKKQLAECAAAGVKPGTYKSRRRRGLSDEEALASPIIERPIQPSDNAADLRPEVGTVYFVRMAGSEFVKIGTTDGEVEDRIASMQTSCPIRLILEAIVEGADARTEQLLHAVCRDRHERGEWFRLKPEEVADICARARVQAAELGVIRRAWRDALERGEFPESGAQALRLLPRRAPGVSPLRAAMLIRNLAETVVVRVSFLRATGHDVAAAFDIEAAAMAMLDAEST